MKNHLLNAVSKIIRHSTSSEAAETIWNRLTAAFSMAEPSFPMLVQSPQPSDDPDSNFIIFYDHQSMPTTLDPIEREGVKSAIAAWNNSIPRQDCYREEGGKIAGMSVFKQDNNGNRVLLWTPQDLSGRKVEGAFAGWLLPILMRWETLLNGRWANWNDQATKNVDLTRIAYMDFEGQPRESVMNMLYTCMSYINPNWRADPVQGLDTLEYLVNWILWSLNHPSVPHQPKDRWTGRAYDFLYQSFRVQDLLLYPFDYLGEILIQAFKVPITSSSISAINIEDNQYFFDPNIQTGRRLMLASNYTNSLGGAVRLDSDGELDLLMGKIALINMYLYVPSGIGTILFDPDETQVDQGISTAIQMARLDSGFDTAIQSDEGHFEIQHINPETIASPEFQVVSPFMVFDQTIYREKEIKSSTLAQPTAAKTQKTIFEIPAPAANLDASLNALAPATNLDASFNALAPATNLDASFNALAPADNLDASFNALAPATNLDASFNALAPAANLDASFNALAPANNLDASFNALAPAANLDASFNALAPANNLDASFNALAPAANLDASLNALAPANNLDASFNALAPAFNLDASLNALEIRREPIPVALPPITAQESKLVNPLILVKHEKEGDGEGDVTTIEVFGGDHA